MSPTLTLYTRSGCSLCDEMHRELLSMASRTDLVLTVVDIDGDAALAQRYGHRVPVPVLCGSEGNELCHYFLDHGALEGYFATP